MKVKKTLMIQAIIFLTFAFAFLFFYGIKPHYNWDLLGYTGIMYLWDGETPEEIHSKAYELVEKSIPNEKFDSISVLTDYQIQNHKDYRVFYSQLPYYLIRPLYNGINYVAFKAGAPFVEFTYYSSVGLYLIMFIYMLAWLNMFMKPVPAQCLVLITFLGTYYIKVMFFSTPDALALMAVFLGLFYLVAARKIIVGYSWLIIAQLARTDTIIYAIIAALFVLALKIDKHNKHFLRAGIFISSSLIFLFLINYFSGAYSYSVTFHQTLLGYLNRPDLSGYTLSFEDYFQQFKGNLGELLRQRFFTVFWAALFAIVIVKIFKAKIVREIEYLYYAILTMALAHYALLPVVWHRFFMCFYFINLIVISYALKAFLEKYGANGKIYKYIFSR